MCTNTYIHNHAHPRIYIHECMRDTTKIIFTNLSPPFQHGYVWCGNGAAAGNGHGDVSDGGDGAGVVKLGVNVSGGDVPPPPRSKTST